MQINQKNKKATNFAPLRLCAIFYLCRLIKKIKQLQALRLLSFCPKATLRENFQSRKDAKARRLRIKSSTCSFHLIHCKKRKTIINAVCFEFQELLISYKLCASAPFSLQKDNF
jgi:hypothetical protein